VTDDDAVVQHECGHRPGQRKVGDSPLEPGDRTAGGQLPRREWPALAIRDDDLGHVLFVGDQPDRLGRRDAVAEHQRRLDRIAERAGQQVQIVAGIGL
jgi:hypothetical protein